VALLALVVAIIAVVVVLMGGGESYRVTANFQNASQLVNGNLVEVAGVKAGTIKSIELADDGTALVEMDISSEYAPLSENTVAVIRSQGLAGVANRYVQLNMPEGDRQGKMLEDGDTLKLSNTISEVDLDQLFNALNKGTIGDLKNVVKGFEVANAGVGPQTNKSFEYLNPFLSTSRNVLSELSSDDARLDRFIVDAATLSETLADRSSDLTGFVRNSDQALGAIAAENVALTETLSKLPDFMRNFNTTGVNLRATLDDLDPLVDASIPVARKLKPFTAALRGFAIDAVPTVRRLDAIIRRPGANNDLTELTRLQVPLANIATGMVQRNGESRPGALPVSTQALRRGLKQLAFFRPYTTDLVAWFDDFGHSGVYDANGGIGRISTTFNAFTISPATGLPDLLNPDSLISTVLGGAGGGGSSSPAALIANGLTVDQLERCPGSNERDPGDGSTPFTDDGALDCDPSQVPPGP